MAQNSIVPRSQEDYIIQVSEKIGERVKKSCLKSSVGQKTAYWDFLMNPLD